MSSVVSHGCVSWCECVVVKERIVVSVGGEIYCEVWGSNVIVCRVL